MHRVHAEAFIRRGEAEEVLEVATEVVLSNATSEEEPEVLPILHFGLFDMTVSEAKAVLATASRSEAEGMRVEEAAGKARSTLLAAIDERLEE